MRRPKRQSGASLDSLLDTMTNVVGILVILLTVTQLGVSDAVKRISTSDSVRPEVFERTVQELLELYKLRVKLSRRLKAFTEHKSDNTALELKRLLSQIADYEADIKALLEGEKEKELAEELALKKLQEEARRLLDEQNKEAGALLAKLNHSEGELARLRALLTDTPVQGPLPVKVINLPNPRPAPEGIEPITFICREGRILHVDIEGLQERALKRVAFVISRRKLGQDPAAGVDGKILADDFNREPVKDRSFELNMTISGRVLRLVFGRHKEAGETTEQLKRSSSRYRQRVKRIDPRKYYARFLVWPDSFETYLEARRICIDRGLLAGWELQSSSGEYTANLAGKLRVGPPPPPPKPKPPPKPGEEPPAPRPPPKPVPKDEID